ncbi:uncharacterized protein LOC142343819 isoform X1 [Convolutriloba macropyga]|uniref:uncharacterized protein LOC142343819 isoform X1 n=1 Tax=Convolutriloba macropyga TaxID=536237 RepID=UPI003F5269A4
MLLLLLMIALQLSPHFGLNQDLEEPFLLKFGPSKGDSFNSKLWDACSEEQFFGRGLKFGRNYYKSCYVCMNGYLAFGKQYRGYDPSSFNIGNTPVGTSFNNNGNCNNGGNLPTPDATTSLTNQIVVTTTTPDNFVNTTSVSSQGNTTIGDLSKNTTPSPSAAETTTQWSTKTTNWSSVSTNTGESVDQTTQLPTEYVTSSGWLDSTTQIRDSTQDSTTKGTPFNGWPENTTPPDIQTFGSGESVDKTTQLPMEYVTSSGWLDSTTQIRDSTQDSTTKGTPFNGWPENTTPPDIQTFGSGELVDKTTQLPMEYVTSSGWLDSTTQIRDSTQDSTTKGTPFNGWPENTTPPDIQTFGSGESVDKTTQLPTEYVTSSGWLDSTTQIRDSTKDSTTKGTTFNGWPENTTPPDIQTFGSGELADKTTQIPTEYVTSSGWLDSTTQISNSTQDSTTKGTPFNGWPENTTPLDIQTFGSGESVDKTTQTPTEYVNSSGWLDSTTQIRDSTQDSTTKGTTFNGWPENTTPPDIQTFGSGELVDKTTQLPMEYVTSSGWLDSTTQIRDSTQDSTTKGKPFNGWPENTTPPVIQTFGSGESVDKTTQLPTEYVTSSGWLYSTTQISNSTRDSTTKGIPFNGWPENTTPLDIQTFGSGESVDKTTQTPTEYVTSSGWLDSTTQIRDSTQDSITKGATFNGWPENTTPPDIQTFGSGESVEKTTQTPTEYVTSSGWLDSTTLIMDSTQDSTTKGTPFNWWPENTTPPDIQTFDSVKSVDKTTQTPTEYVTSSGWLDSTTQIRDSTQDITTKGTTFNGWPENTTPLDIQTFGSGESVDKTTHTPTEYVTSSGWLDSATQIRDSTQDSTTNGTPFNGWQEKTTLPDIQTFGSGESVDKTTQTLTEYVTSSGWLDSTTQIRDSTQDSTTKGTTFNGWPENTTPPGIQTFGSGESMDKTTQTPTEYETSSGWLDKTTQIRDSTQDSTTRGTMFNGWPENTTPLDIQTFGSGESVDKKPQTPTEYVTSSGWLDITTQIRDSTKDSTTKGPPFNGWPENTTPPDIQTLGSGESVDKTTQTPFEYVTSSGWLDSTTQIRDSTKDSTTKGTPFNGWPEFTTPPDIQTLGSGESVDKTTQTPTEYVTSSGWLDSTTQIRDSTKDSTTKGTPFNGWPEFTTPPDIQTFGSGESVDKTTQTPTEYVTSSGWLDSTTQIRDSTKDSTTKGPPFNGWPENTTPPDIQTLGSGESVDKKPQTPTEYVTSSGWLDITTQIRDSTKDSTTKGPPFNGWPENTTPPDIQTLGSGESVDKTTQTPTEYVTSSGWLDSTTQIRDSTKDSTTKGTPFNGWPEFTTPPDIQTFGSGESVDKTTQTPTEYVTSSGWLDSTTQIRDSTKDSTTKGTPFNGWPEFTTPPDIQTFGSGESVDKTTQTPTEYVTSSGWLDSTTQIRDSTKDSTTKGTPFNGWSEFTTPPDIQTFGSGESVDKTTQIPTEYVTSSGWLDSTTQISNSTQDSTTKGTPFNGWPENTTPPDIQTFGSGESLDKTTQTPTEYVISSGWLDITTQIRDKTQDSTTKGTTFNGWPENTTPPDIQTIGSGESVDKTTQLPPAYVTSSGWLDSTTQIRDSTQDSTTKGTPFNGWPESTTPPDIQTLGSGELEESSTTSTYDTRGSGEKLGSTTQKATTNTPFNVWPEVTTLIAFESSHSSGWSESSTMTTDSNTSSQKPQSTISVASKNIGTAFNGWPENTTPTTVETLGSSGWWESRTTSAYNTESRNEHLSSVTRKATTMTPFNGWPEVTTPETFEISVSSGWSQNRGVSATDSRVSSQKSQSTITTVPESATETATQNSHSSGLIESSTISTSNNQVSSDDGSYPTSRVTTKNAMNFLPENTTPTAFETSGANGWLLESSTVSKNDGQAISIGSYGASPAAIKSTVFDGFVESTIPAVVEITGSGFRLESSTVSANINQDSSDESRSTEPDDTSSIPFIGSLETTNTTAAETARWRDWLDRSTLPTNDLGISRDKSFSTAPVINKNTVVKTTTPNEITTAAHNNIDSTEVATSGTTLIYEQRTYRQNSRSPKTAASRSTELNGWPENTTPHGSDTFQETTQQALRNAESNFSSSVDHTAFNGWFESPTPFVTKNSPTDSLKTSTPTPAENTASNGWWESNTVPTTRQIANQSTTPGGNFQNSTSAPPNVGGTTAIGYNWPFGDLRQFRNKRSSSCEPEVSKTLSLVAPFFQRHWDLGQPTGLRMH